MAKEAIKTGKYVELAYKIYSIGDGGERQLEYEFSDQNPDHFVMGAEPGMLNAFMVRLQGLKAGDTFDFTLTPAQAFGEHDESIVVEIEKKMFCDMDGNFMDGLVTVGNVMTMMTAEGYSVQGMVKSIGEETITMDFNHRLAGRSVAYVGKVRLVRDAIAEDLPQHHGCGGCSCDSCDGHDHGHDCGGCGGCH